MNWSCSPLPPVSGAVQLLAREAVPNMSAPLALMHGLAVLTLGAVLHVAGETAKIVFNEQGEGIDATPMRPMDLVAQNSSLSANSNRHVHEGMHNNNPADDHTAAAPYGGAARPAPDKGAGTTTLTPTQRSSTPPSALRGRAPALAGTVG